MKEYQLAVRIVNMINEDYHLDLKTVDAAQMTDDVFKLLTTPPRAEQEGKEVVDIVFKKLNEWAYNETNEAGTKLIVIDASDLPEIKKEIMDEVARLSQPTP